MTNTILIMAGGTGGHIFPGLAVAHELKKRGWHVNWLGTKDGMESRIVPDHGFKIDFLQISGVRGKRLLSLFKIPFYLIKSLYHSNKVISRIKPNIILSMGGYVAFPGGVVSLFRNIPLIVHEQNSIPGLTNKLLSRFAERNLVGFPNALPKAEHTGNPVRKELHFRDDLEERYGSRKGPLRILIMGGSRGADTLNRVAPEAVSLFLTDQRPNIIHQCGLNKSESVMKKYESKKLKADCHDFLSNMEEVYKYVDLLICRAGAMTVSEVTSIGIASIFIPFPHAVDDHQTKNALFLVSIGAAILIPERELSPSALASAIGKIDRNEAVKMARKARQVYRPDSAQIIADVCIGEVTKNAS